MVRDQAAPPKIDSEAGERPSSASLTVGVLPRILMQQQEWQQIKEIFTAALKLSDAKRARFLAEACSSDELLRNLAGLLFWSRRVAGLAWRFHWTGSPRPRAMIRRWTSLVPSPISRIFASR